MELIAENIHLIIELTIFPLVASIVKLVDKRFKKMEKEINTINGDLKNVYHKEDLNNLLALHTKPIETKLDLVIDLYKNNAAKYSLKKFKI